MIDMFKSKYFDVDFELNKSKLLNEVAGCAFSWAFSGDLCGLIHPLMPLQKQLLITVENELKILKTGSTKINCHFT